MSLILAYGFGAGTVHIGQRITTQTITTTNVVANYSLASYPILGLNIMLAALSSIAAIVFFMKWMDFE